VDQDEYDYRQAQRQDNSKRIASAAITTVCVIAWLILRVNRCEREREENDYRFTYTPTYDYSPSIPSYDYTPKKTLLDVVHELDANWLGAINEVDPLVIAADAKNTQCQALDGVAEDAGTWKIAVDEMAFAGDATETDVKSQFPMFIAAADEERSSFSPEASARYELAVNSGAATIPRLTTRDLYVEIALMPKPGKGVPKVKGIAAGKVIVRGWVYDHAIDRVVCAGVMLLPNPKRGADATKLDDAQINKLVDKVPNALKTVTVAVEKDQ